MKGAIFLCNSFVSSEQYWNNRVFFLFAVFVRDSLFSFSEPNIYLLYLNPHIARKIKQQKVILPPGSMS